MNNYKTYKENAEHYLNCPIPDKEKAIYFYIKAIKSTKDIEKQSILSNNINQLKGNIDVEKIVKQIENE